MPAIHEYSELHTITAEGNKVTENKYQRKTATGQTEISGSRALCELHQVVCSLVPTYRRKLPSSREMRSCEWYVSDPCISFQTFRRFLHEALLILKLRVSQSTFLHFIAPQVSSPCSQQPAIGPYPEPDESNPRLTPYFRYVCFISGLPSHEQTTPSSSSLPKAF
jgi:hypothetical protein